MRRLGIGLLLVISALVTAKLVALLADGIPIVQQQHGWFWPIHAGHPGIVVFALACFATPLAVHLAADYRHGQLLWRAFALVLFGFVLQHGLAFSEKRGWDGMRGRLEHSGHAEFVITASRELRALDVVRHYESFVRAPDQPYARSKPPGHLLFYMACAPVADALMPLLWDPPRPPNLAVNSERYWRLVNFATLFFPLLSMLPILPLAYLASVLSARERALWPGLLFALTPQVQLVTQHLDQVLYPLLVTATWALATKAASTASRGRFAWWAAAGALLWLDLFVSFSLLPAIVPLIFVPFVVPGASLAERAKRLASGGAAALASLGLLAALFRLLLAYDPLVAYRRGFQNHVRWNAWDDTMRWWAAKLDLSEFVYWTGVAIVLSFFVACFARLWRPRPLTAFAWGTLAAILVTATIGKTIGEVARLWMFFVPAVVLVAADGLSTIVKRRTVPALMAIAAIQLAWIVAIKNFQDFR